MYSAYALLYVVICLFIVHRSSASLKSPLLAQQNLSMYDAIFDDNIQIHKQLLEFNSKNK